MICVSLSHIDQVEKAVKSGAGLLELRLDLMGKRPEELFPHVPDSLPTVVTCRPGIHTEDERAALLTKCLELGAAYVDVETESSAAFLAEIKESTVRYGARLIVSYHNYERTLDLEDLESVVMACYEKGGDLAKVATRVKESDDVLNLLALYRMPGQKVILGMGPQGRILRLVGPYLGGAFTFASLDEGEETAPGQLSVQEMMDIYKVINKS